MEKWSFYESHLWGNNYPKCNLNNQSPINIDTELVKECKRVPRISPPPPAFAELINQCMQLGVMSANSFGERDFDPKISYWTELKQQYLKDNPDVITLDNYKEKNGK